MAFAIADERHKAAFERLAPNYVPVHNHCLKKSWLGALRQIGGL
jgi:hypothetical protein